MHINRQIGKTTFLGTTGNPANPGTGRYSKKGFAKCFTVRPLSMNCNGNICNELFL
jgi:hypothetical protein